MAGAMIEFRTLGAVSLKDAGAGDVDSVLAQPKRLALLAYLALARPRGFHRRNTLLAMFWPEDDEKHARWSLNQALRHLRKGSTADIYSRDSTLSTAPTSNTGWTANARDFVAEPSKRPGS
jgi:serine/threonine-protein kinase